MLRVQNERHSESSFDKNAYIKQFGLTKPKLNKEIPIFHPGPVNIGVELDLDIIKSQNYKGYEQVKNSIYMRMAIIDAILNRRNDEENASL